MSHQRGAFRPQPDGVPTSAPHPVAPLGLRPRAYAISPRLLMPSTFLRRARSLSTLWSSDSTASA